MFGGFDDEILADADVSRAKSLVVGVANNMINFSAKKTPNGWELRWQSPVMSAALYDRFVPYFRGSHDYAALTRERLREIIGFLALQNERYASDVDLPAVLSLRNIVIKDKIIKNYYRMNAKIREIAREYKAGADIVQLSFKWDFPPINLLRGIFLTKYNPTVIYAAFTRNGDASELNTHDRAQLARAQSHDAESFFNIDLATKNAAINEATFIEFFKKLGIAMETQDDLVAQQKQTHGHAVITPDILFTDRVSINGQNVRWIEFKNYLGTDLFLRKSNAAQTAKYYEKWGHGAICYSFGAVDNVVYPNTMILNASALPIDIITPLVEIQEEI